MKDYSIRHSSCYDNSVTGMLSRDLDTLGIRNPFKRFDYAAILKFNFWNGDYFFDDMSWRADVCGDANVMPFWCGVITDKLLLKKALSSVRKAGLDRPIPLKYTQKKSRGQMMISYERLAGDYERDSAWAHMGLMFIKNVATINKSLARRYLRQYRDNILKHKNFLEVYDSKGMPFKTWLYHADEGMLWCANYLALKKELGI